MARTYGISPDSWIKCGDDMKEKKKHKGLIAAVLVLFLVLLAGVFLLSVQVEEIQVNGNLKYEDQEIIDMIFDGKWDRHVLYTYYKDKTKPHKQLPFIEDYKIRFKSFNSIEVIVYEKSVVGYIDYMGSCMYFDKDGIIVESSNEVLPGVPLVTGLKFGHIILYKPLPVENNKIFEDIMNLTQQLALYEIGVDKIFYDNGHEVTLFIQSVKVVLGSNQNINGKIGVLKDVLPKVEGLSGVLYLDNYDPSNTKPMYTFKPG